MNAYFKFMIRHFLKNVKQQCLVGILIPAVLFLAFSSFQFSALLTLAGTIQAYGFALILLHTRQNYDVAGLSKISMNLYLLAFVVRLFPMTLYQGYLPIDASGSVLFRLQEYLMLVMVAFLSQHYFSRFKATHNS